MKKLENETTIADVEDIKTNVYEISYILVPSLSEEQVTRKIEEIKAAIASKGASFISEEVAYLRDLAYEMTRVIKNANNRFNTGYFGWIKFEMSTDSIKAIEASLKLDEDVIRFLVVKAERDINIFTKKETLNEMSNETDDMVNIDTSEEVEAETPVVQA